MTTSNRKFWIWWFWRESADGLPGSVSGVHQGWYCLCGGRRSTLLTLLPPHCRRLQGVLRTMVVLNRSNKNINIFMHYLYSLLTLQTWFVCNGHPPPPPTYKNKHKIQIMCTFSRFIHMYTHYCKLSQQYYCNKEKVDQQNKTVFGVKNPTITCTWVTRDHFFLCNFSHPSHLQYPSTSVFRWVSKTCLNTCLKFSKHL